MKKLKLVGKPKQVSKKKIVPLSDVILPSQMKDDVQLIETDTKILMEMAKPNLFRDAILDSKLKFIAELDKLSAACGLSCDMRIYFTFTQLGKKE